MTMPAWNDHAHRAGTMVKAALWLVQVVGEGNTFTKEEVRQLFPGVSQADRRVRDLRDYGWIIHASNEDATLMAEDQRFVKAGVPVWDPVARRAAAPSKAVPAKLAREIMSRDDHMCTLCGISGGEPYPDDSNQSAVLFVARRDTLMLGGSEDALLVTECKRCRAGSSGEPVPAIDLLAEINSLDEADRRRLGRWIKRGRRISTPLERTWASYRRLPADARKDIAAALGE